MSFDSLLIANRGEIAVRIITTARRMGLRTIAVYSDADRGALHVHEADEAHYLGPTPAAESYLRGDRILEIAAATGTGAIHPGYGFLSESAEFARDCEAAGIAFIGPAPEHLEAFGAKHTARALASAANVPMLPGSELLADLDEARAAAAEIGYPVMLKATAGGGGIGMQACPDEAALDAAWETVTRLAGANFSSAGVFLEAQVTRARHIEVQVFGDGEGRVVALGNRDCSLQRRNQKVVEESPAPGLPDAVAQRIEEAAIALCQSVRYRSAGTVEYVYDSARHEASFLEVNTRLQVEHPVTEARFGVDLVEWMIRLAQGDSTMLDAVPEPSGAAVEARVYAENTDQGNLPSAGTVTAVRFPGAARVDTWIEAGSEVSTAYDPMLAKVIVTGRDRSDAWLHLRSALAATTIQGVATNVGLLRSVVEDEVVLAGMHTTATLGGIENASPRLTVVRPGLMALVVDWPGRVGLWQVGIPPSGPMDDLSFRLGNLTLGNHEGAPGIEVTLGNASFQFHAAARVVVTGAPAPLTIDGVETPMWEPVVVPAGATVEIGAPTSGMRTYLLVEAGLAVLPTLGSATTFTDGAMGGVTGRALRPGDVIDLRTPAIPRQVAPIPARHRPEIGTEWTIGVTEGPHAAPEFFTPADMERFYSHPWEVHFNSARTGVRLVGPAPEWARTDGGEAGLHPSNIHDTPYTVGAVDYTGDMPILLGPDGPSLGGFTCPATIPSGQRWKLGQLRPGDTVHFTPITLAEAYRLRATPTATPFSGRGAVEDSGIVAQRPARDDAPALTIRRQGDTAILVEYGDMVLDIALRMRIAAFAAALADRAVTGIVDVTPGIRSLQVHVDPDWLGVEEATVLALDIDAALPPTSELRVPSRTVWMPLSWDDPATREAIARYMAGVRDDAPWCPWNIEFIRRINGLASVEDVYRTVFEAEYLVLGLGDVYLGAPVATPLDPRHRLVTTKYNPARTWTAQNSVGIGGSYLCIYGMEGPGGYQFVGRTTQVWATYAQRGSFTAGTPWLLRFFDRIRWYPVETEELDQLRAETAAGRGRLRIEDGEFSMAEYQEFLAANAESIAEFRDAQQAAFAAEREAWRRSGEFERVAELVASDDGPAVETAVPEGCQAVEAPFPANVFRIDVQVGDHVDAGQVLLAVEAMKMEAPVVAPFAGTVEEILVTPGSHVVPGTAVAFIRTAS